MGLAFTAFAVTSPQAGSGPKIVCPNHVNAIMDCCECFDHNGVRMKCNSSSSILVYLMSRSKMTGTPRLRWLRGMGICRGMGETEMFVRRQRAFSVDERGRARRVVERVNGYSLYHNIASGFVSRA
jgi:hypothetical protein